MVTEVIIPQFGTSVESVTLVAWFIEEGEEVSRGDILCEVETDKSTNEIESFAEGILLKQVVTEGSPVKLGSLIAYIGEEGDEIPDHQEQSVPEPASEPASEPAKGPGDDPAQQEQSLPKTELTKGVDTGKIKASPKIRKMAGEMQVDLSLVIATGRGGQITEEDVKNSASGAPVPPLSRNQLAVSRTIQKSYREIIPINLVGKIEMTPVMERRAVFLEETGQKLLYEAQFVYAVSRVIMSFPRFCSHFENNTLTAPSDINIGVAVSTETELYLPVVKGAGTKSLAEINKEIAEYAEKAQKGTLSDEEMSDGVFTISNLGMYPVDFFNVIIPPGQSAALSIGQAEERPVFEEGRLKAELFARIMLSVDHRFINGREAAQFLAELKKNLGL